MPSEHDYQEIYSTANRGELAFIRSIFEAEEIRFVMLGDEVAGIYPSVLPARILVSRDDVERAREVLKSVLQPDGARSTDEDC
ncbi:MAG TPA: DUF2007 domain-containing protein [Thermodesulfobacteriota bacterium]|nr:DUF2007 domain-containing protein [Deltaproteobacteria bacterium]HNR12569.1 DUF2007 domain-containing protein [Thermodesulfobacteriota bacterium]HNU71496.1 DUF2007 domain-containing protein [Thermodesulfobacteriota bacterium]HQO77352.1 DUF2007 domain-containing protein [Thermodesulfobacteriota bacterium]